MISDNSLWHRGFGKEWSLGISPFTCLTWKSPLAIGPTLSAPGVSTRYNGRLWWKSTVNLDVELGGKMGKSSYLLSRDLVTKQVLHLNWSKSTLNLDIELGGKMGKSSYLLSTDLVTKQVLHLNWSKSTLNLDVELGEILREKDICSPENDTKRNPWRFRSWKFPSILRFPAITLGWILGEPREIGSVLHPSHLCVPQVERHHEVEEANRWSWSLCPESWGFCSFNIGWVTKM